ncbi:MAG: hypothetical protein AVDCRST_MAG07-1614 [uncultured Frankineae bacterium]|uniref:Uncharacterized protein n=1 Tax=uncultured Frankineae bacterium TaxID=437475 RepID=A0A6J4L0H2_9ACTN|nr:MAG: hypothetical protein AVDCRST_MAG07-1614 [uncultured Frankineae bacterium]
MFRDSRGVVHTVCSADPMEDLPPGAVRALQAALLQPGVPDLGSVLERCDAVRELVERWQDAFFAALPDEVDVEEEARWAAEAGISLAEVETQYEDDEDDDDAPVLLDDDEDDEELDGLVALAGPDEHDPRHLLPEDLVAVLERELLLLPLRVRLEALVAAADLVSTWSDLVADQEKLLGHLVLAHGEPQAALGHELLVERHATLHDAHGPGHASGPT